jgi:hypothetical protein
MASKKRILEDCPRLLLRRLSARPNDLQEMVEYCYGLEWLLYCVGLVLLCSNA